MRASTSRLVDFAADRRSTLLAARRAKNWLTESFSRCSYFYRRENIYEYICNGRFQDEKKK